MRILAITAMVCTLLTNHTPVYFQNPMRMLCVVHLPVYLNVAIHNAPTGLKT